MRQFKRVNDKQLQILSQVTQGQAVQCDKTPLKESDMNVMLQIRPEPEMPGKVQQALCPSWKVQQREWSFSCTCLFELLHDNQL